MNNKILLEDFMKISARSTAWNKMKNKAILITGANGFIPSYIVKFLLHLNDYMNLKIKIIGIVRNKKNAKSRFGTLLNRQDFKIIVQDVSHPLTFNKNVDFIIHGASQANPRSYETDPVGTLKPNVLGTFHLLEFARIKRVESILFISAGETYGSIMTAGKKDEKTYGSLDPAVVRSCYAESKRMTETMAVSWYHQYNIPAKIVRLYHTYGPGLNLKDGRVFSDFIDNIVKNENIVMKSRGEAVRSFIYIADVVSAFFTVLLQGKNGEAYNVANEKVTLSIRKLAQTLTQLFPEKKLKVVFKKRGKKDTYIESPIKFNYPSTTKLQTLGWKPHYSLQEGFKRTIKSFENLL